MEHLAPAAMVGVLGGFILCLAVINLVESGAERIRSRARINAARKRSAWIVGQCRRLP